MKIKYGKGKTKYGLGIEIKLTGNEVATAIDAYLVAHNIYINGPRTISVNGQLCKEGKIYVDPSGFVVANGRKWSGRGIKDLRTLIHTIMKKERLAQLLSTLFFGILIGISLTFKGKMPECEKTPYTLGDIFYVNIFFFILWVFGYLSKENK